jgi:hypothetical protein
MSSAMTQAVSFEPPTKDARAQLQASSCGISGGHNGVGTGFSPSTMVFAYQYHLPK